MALPTPKLFGGNPVTVNDPLPAILVDLNGNPLVSANGLAVTEADGANVAIGAKADAAAQSGSASVIALLKYIAAMVKDEDAAHASGDKGVPLWGVRNSGGVTLTNADGDYSPIAVDARGRIDTVAGFIGSPADGITATVTLWGKDGNSAPLAVQPGNYNGSSWDSQRGNVNGTALASAARTSTTSSADIVNYNGRGIMVFLSVSAASGTGGLQVSIEAKDPVSGFYAALHTLPAAITTISNSAFAVYPGGPGAPWYNNVLSRTLRIRVIHGDSSSYTYAVGYCNVS